MTRVRKTRKVWLSLLMALVLAATACAGDDTTPPADAGDDTTPPADAGDATDGEEPVDDGEEPVDDDLYAGETITIYVGFGPGGGFDTYARLLARHLPRHLPGEPNVIVENMPGAGSLAVIEFIATVAEPDGMSIAAFNEAQLLAQLLSPEFSVDLRELEWLGSAMVNVTTCAIRTDLGFETFDDVLASDEQLTLGASSPGSNTHDLPAAMAGLLEGGDNISIVSGYDGTGEMRLATESGEVDGACWDWPSMSATAAHWFEDDFAQVLVQQGPHRHADLADVPLASELAANESDARLIAATMEPGAVSKPYATAPGTDQVYVTALRNGIAAAMADDELRAEAEQAGLELEPKGGQEIQEFVNHYLDSMDEGLLERLREVLR